MLLLLSSSSSLVRVVYMNTVTNLGYSIPFPSYFSTCLCVYMVFFFFFFYTSLIYKFYGSFLWFIFIFALPPILSCPDLRKKFWFRFLNLLILLLSLLLLWLSSSILPQPKTVAYQWWESYHSTFYPFFVPAWFLSFILIISFIISIPNELDLFMNMLLNPILFLFQLMSILF